MNRQLYLGLLLSLTCAVAQAQSFKCKTAEGKSFFSDTGCPGKSTLLTVQQAEYISADRQRQAQAVNDRRSAQLQQIDSENAAFNESLRRQQQAVAAEDARQGRQQASDNMRRQRDECDQLATNRNMSRSQRAALAEICAKPEPSRERFDDCKDKIARATSPSQRAMIASHCTGDPDAGARVRDVSRPAPMPMPAPPPPLAVIKNCNGDSCADQLGNRYSTTAGKIVRQDGKRCYQQGNAMYCD